MNLFPDRRKEKIRRRLLSALLVFALLVAMAGLAGWLALRYYLSGAARPPETESSSSTPVVDIPTGSATSLLILGDAGQERFLLVQFAPATGRVYVLPLPGNTDDGTGQSLSVALEKYGPARVKAAVEATLSLPLSHYIRLDAAAVESFLNNLEGSVTLDLPEAVSYTDENGGKVRLSAGQRQITAGQGGALLRYTGWSQPSVGDTAATRLVCAVFDRFMRPGRRFSGDFAALSNLAQTDLRIDHFTAYATTLDYLAAGNTDGSLATKLTPSGTTSGGLFLPDVEHLRAQTPLYTHLKEGEK